MDRIDRRSALAFGIAAGSAAVVSGRATAQGAKQGKEIAPGVHVVELSKRDSMVPRYKTVSMRDLTYEPKAKSSNPSMPNDMVCHCPQGELRVRQSNGHEFTVKQGDVWSCNKGLGEDLENIGSGVAIMRVIDLLPG